MQAIRPSPDRPAAAVAAILSVSDRELDYLQAKLALDRIVDPAVDVAAALDELNRLESQAWRLAGQHPTDEAKLGALRTLLHEGGPWNDYRPFAYDHSDPLGQHIPNMLLHNYLATRLGQCVSMPSLYLVLAKRLGLNVALAAAPGHIFVRYTDPLGRTFNLETTSGAHPARTEWLRRNFPMNDRAVESGLYLRTLMAREGMALLANTVLAHLWRLRHHDEMIEVARTILQHSPRDGATMAALGASYGSMLRTEFEERYPIPFLIPECLRWRRLFLIERTHSLIAAAKALGWEADRPAEV